jgi:hypothetical protein
MLSMFLFTSSRTNVKEARRASCSHAKSPDICVSRHPIDVDNLDGARQGRRSRCHIGRAELCEVDDRCSAEADWLANLVVGRAATAVESKHVQLAA